METKELEVVLAVKKGYKVDKDLTRIKNEIILWGWEQYKNEISMKEYLEILSAMPMSLSHLYLVLRQ